MSEKIAVFSNSRGLVSITLPELKLNKSWPQKGAKVLIEKEQLEEAMYNPGVEYMFKTGILYIENMQTKIDLGLEPEGATAPQNIIFMTDKEKGEFMSPKRQAWELKAKLEQMSYENKKDFCDYVIENELLDTAKAKVIKEVCGVDILHAIRMKQANDAI